MAEYNQKLALCNYLSFQEKNKVLGDIFFLSSL